MEKIMNHQRAALRNWLRENDYPETAHSDIEASAWNDDELFDANGHEYLVLTDKQADQRAADDIRECLWAFNYDFVAGHSKAAAAIDEDSYQKMQSVQCENFNVFVEAIIDDMKHFIDDAISADGRGHFLSTYDGEEHEAKANGKTFFIYQTN
jgi:hypothetical protein|tara:strand:- start:404 stop:862 length:459 start_codon:yes stop_codon:yes gene_type:complete